MLRFAHVVVFASLACLSDARSPNVLFIIADDQSSLDLKVYNPQSQTRHAND